MRPKTPGHMARKDGPLSTQCWLWTRTTTTDGYGHLQVQGREWLAHRYLWTLMRGPIPAGMELDHLCRVRRCVNPQHLEVVTHRENLLRGDTIVAAFALKTHCPQGHAYDLVNTYNHPNGQRVCRECKKVGNRAYKLRRRLAVAV